MTARLTLLCILAALLLPALSSGEDLLLYTPKPTEAEQAPKSPDEGVLVKSVTVKRGDTLKKLSRKHLGRSSWFPQVLVFNEIRNPDLIHPGEKIRIPVPAGHSAAAEQKGTPKKKVSRHGKPHARHRTEVRNVAAGSQEGQQAVSPKSRETAPSHMAPASSDEQETFLQAKLAYIKGDYQKSLRLFDQFLSRFPRSNSTADAALYRADCLLQLSRR